MTVASEISRLQDAKAGIRQAIIDKGVDVGSELTIDEYACCIESIESGGGGGRIAEIIVVGGGGGGGSGSCEDSYNCVKGGGGGGGEVIAGNYLLECTCYNITVGTGGNGGAGGHCAGFNAGADGTYSEMPGIACARGGYGSKSKGIGGCSATGCTGGGKAGNYDRVCKGGGGGGACGNGCNATDTDSAGHRGGNGGLGYCGFGGGGGGGESGSGCCGGGNGGSNGGGGNASACGGGGGGGGMYRCRSCAGGKGGGGLVQISYVIGAGIKCATGGNCCTCVMVDGIPYKYIHCFTTSGTFCIVC